MAKKKFFNSKVSKKPNIKIGIIIGSVIIALLIIAIIIVLLQKDDKPNTEINIAKNEVSIEINETMIDDILFVDKKYMDSSVITYPDDFSTKTIGRYMVKIKNNNKEYEVVVNVVDTTAPVLELKDLTFNRVVIYSPKDFVVSCVDNSGKECILSFQKFLDDEGKEIDSAHIIKEGTHEIKIKASDESGNEIIKSAKITMGKKTEISPVDCKYGDNKYVEALFTLASDVSVNGCAVNPDFYDNDTTLSNVNKMLSTEMQRIKKDLNKLSLEGDYAINRSINIINNTEDKGLVGYEIEITITLTHKEKTEVIAEYKLNTSGNRIFKENKYNLAS